ncbi:MAG: ester cyclase [Chloroflexi bacterium]|nr:ester cyclase [Chloroflexota bacterium]
MLEQNKVLVDRLTEAFNRADWLVIDELVSPDFVGHNPLSLQPMQGAAALKGFFTAVHAAMPDVHHPHWLLIAENDLVAIHTPIKGTFTHEFMSVPPNGNVVFVWMANIWRVQDGKLVEWWSNFDTLMFMQQLNAATMDL